MIPTMIYEEAQGNAIIRTLQHHENSRNEKLPEFQEIINNLFVGLKTRLQRTEIAWLTRKRIAALIVCAANSTNSNRDERTEQWRKIANNLKKEIERTKHTQPKVATKIELANLTIEASIANKAIETIQALCRTDDGENLKINTMITYRRQLRASHLQILENLRNINKEIISKQNQQLQW